MKILRLLMLLGFISFATGCTEDLITPQTDPDEQDTPVVVGDPTDEDSGD